VTGCGSAVPRAARRAFTLLEIMIVIGVILTLMTLVLGVGSALLRNAEKSQVESAMAIMESALNEYEAQMGRPVTFNGAWQGTQQQWFPIGANDAVFDVRDPGGPPPTVGVNSARRAQGMGVFVVNLLRQVDTVRPVLSGIPAALLRPEPNQGPDYPARNIGGTGSLLYVPSAKQPAGPRDSTRAEFVDTWGNRVAFVLPGRAYRFGAEAPGALPDADGSVRTPYEETFGVCSNRRIGMVSAGPDGLFGVPGEIVPATQDTVAARAVSAADNILLYPLDPPQ
jgi:prepilin-type N-terminal cleavage/methylation domain-containing protein